MRNSDGILVTEIFWFSVVNMLTFSFSPFVLLNIRNKIQNHIELNYSPKYFEKKKTKHSSIRTTIFIKISRQLIFLILLTPWYIIIHRIITERKWQTRRVPHSHKRNSENLKQRHFYRRAAKKFYWKLAYLFDSEKKCSRDRRARNFA